MENILTTSNIMFALGIIGLIFTIWEKIKNPQIKLDKDQALTEQEMEGKSSMLLLRMKMKDEANEVKFKDLGLKIEDAFKMAYNHTHTVDTKVDRLIEQTNGMCLNIKELATIINERIPKK